MATFYSNSYDGRQLSLDVWQDGAYLKWKLNSYGGNSDYYTIYHCKITIAGQVVYNPGTVTWNSYQFPAAKGSTEGSVYIGHSASYREFGVSFIGEVFYNRSTDHGGTVGAGATISAPTVSKASVSSVSDKSAYVSFTDSGNNGTISARGGQVSKTNFGTVVKSFSGGSGTVSGLEPNKTYYARGWATNEAGTTYGAAQSFTTGFTNPGAPSNLRISYNSNEPIPTANYTFAWNAGSAGSKAISGYRFRLFKNNVEVACIDTESSATSKVINGADYNFAVGDVIKFGLYSYSKDWAGNKHFNGDGAAAAQVVSGTITIVSDKYIYVSVNGGSFNKKKMYISVNGGAFKEVKKEKFKVIR